MRWLDVAGPPGSGKSTLCDPLWGPHDLPIENRLPPAQWHDFLNEITRLFCLIEGHWSFPAAVRMNNRSIRKMASVARAAQTEHSPYIQTGLVQRGLGFGWRMNDMGIDLNELRHFFRLMPVSAGVAFTSCPLDVVAQRNRDREKVAATSHENRAFMVPLMQPAIELAQEVLRERTVPVTVIDTRQPVEDARKQLVAAAGLHPCDPEASGPGCQVEVLSPPPWWL
ncbi:MAG: hypothetical protein ACOCSR_00065 [Wenzhouxiangella sp.]